MKGKICDNLQGTEYRILDRYTFHYEYRGVTSTTKLCVMAAGQLTIGAARQWGLGYTYLFFPHFHTNWLGNSVRFSTTHDAKKFPEFHLDSFQLALNPNPKDDNQYDTNRVGKPILHFIVDARDCRSVSMGLDLDQSLRGHLTESSMDIHQSQTAILPCPIRPTEPRGPPL